MKKEIQAKAIEENENKCDILFIDYMQNWLEKKKNKVDIITWEGYSIYSKQTYHFILQIEKA